MRHRLLIAIPLITLFSACFHQSDNDQEKPATTATPEVQETPDYVSVDIADRVQRKVTDGNQISAGVDEIFSAPENGRREIDKSSHFKVFVSTGGDGQAKTLLLNFSVEAGTTGTFGKEKIYAHTFFENERYLHKFGASETTDATVTISRFDGENGKVEGQYVFDLCRDTAISANTCDRTANRVAVSGEFSVTRTADILLQPAGSKASPFFLENADLFFDQTVVPVARDPSYVRARLPKGSNYSLSLREAPDNLVIELFPDSNFATAFCALGRDSSSNACEIEKDEDIFIKLSYTGPHDGTFVTLNSRRITPFTSEGTGSAPLAVDAKEYRGHVGPETPSLYKIATSPGEVLNITLTESNVLVLSGSIKQAASENDCRIYFTGPGSDQSAGCTVVADGDAITVEIDPAEDDGAEFLLSVGEPDNFWPDQGAEEPITISDEMPFAFEGSVARHSVYRVNVEPNATYTFTLSESAGTAASLDLSITEEDSITTFTSLLCQSYERNGAARCAIRPAENTIQVAVRNSGNHSTPFVLRAEKVDTLFDDEWKEIETPAPFTLDASIGMHMSHYHIPVKQGVTYTVSVRGLNAQDFQMNVDTESSTIVSANKVRARAAPVDFGGWTAMDAVPLTTTPATENTTEDAVGFKQIAMTDNSSVFVGTFVTDSNTTQTVGTSTQFPTEFFASTYYTSVAVPTTESTGIQAISFVDTMEKSKRLCTGGFIIQTEIGCSFVATSDTIEVKVNHIESSVGGMFTLVIEESNQNAYQNEGNLEAPLDLGLMPVIHHGSVLSARSFDFRIEGTDTSYYVVNVEPNTRYNVELNKLDASINLHVDTVDSEGTRNQACYDWGLGLLRRNCTVSTYDDTVALLISVSPDYQVTGSTFDLHVRVAE